jgi:hypothetical protein
MAMAFSTTPTTASCSSAPPTVCTSSTSSTPIPSRPPR